MSATWSSTTSIRAWSGWRPTRTPSPASPTWKISLARALRLLESRGLTFRVERVPLCYMAEWAHASTETRKLVKEEERVIHFLDGKGTVRQTGQSFLRARAPACAACRVSAICGGLDGLGDVHDGAPLYPLFVDPAAIAARIRREGD